MTLTQKETLLLKDQQSHEELCIKKYGQYSSEAQDPQLKQLFSNLQKQEEQHLNTINSILSGQIPNTNQQSQQNQQNTFSQTPNQNSTFNEMDAHLCNDLLATEKYVSSTYNTAIFEFKNKNIRQTLNHIQKEEQEHGEALYNYMNNHGMYQ